MVTGRTGSRSTTSPGAGAVDLSGWALTDDSGDLALWVFGPGTVLPDGGYLVVFASDKDRRDPAGPLHTNFKLSGGGEYLALVNSTGSIVTEYAPEYPPQEEDVSYGLSFNPGPARRGATLHRTDSGRRQLGRRAAGLGCHPHAPATH